MKNKISNGGHLSLSAPSGGVTSGVGVKIGGIFGISTVTAPAAALVDIEVAGVFDHPKTASQTFAVGDLVYWDDTNKVMTSTSAGNTKIGLAVLAAAGSDANVRVRLVPII